MTAPHAHPRYFESAALKMLNSTAQKTALPGNKK
jgi:hypothetical protein